MSNVLLTSGSPLALKYKVDSYETAARYSSTASTAVCYEQIFLEEPDPRPQTEDWTNFITSFDPTQYDAFSMTAFVTSVAPRGYTATPLPGCVFRAVESTASGNGHYTGGFGGYETIQVDGIGFVPWTVYASSTSTEVPGMVYVRDMEFSASNSANSQYLETNYMSNWGSTGNPARYLSWEQFGIFTSWTVYYITDPTANLTASYKAEEAMLSGLTDEQRAAITDSGLGIAQWTPNILFSAYATVSNCSSQEAATWPTGGTTDRLLSASASSRRIAPGGSGYSATASVSSLAVGGGDTGVPGLVKAPTASSVYTTSYPARTYSASATASGSIPVIAGSYTGNVSAAVGLYNDFIALNPSGLNTYVDLSRSAWSAGRCYDTPVDCGLSGILELYRKTGTAIQSSIIGSSVEA